MNISEENFISRLKQRDEKALEYVIDNYGWVMKTVVHKYLFNLESHHEECMNDIILLIWNNIQKFDESKGSFKNWVGIISKYKAIDYFRKYKNSIDNENIDDLNIASKHDVHEEITKDHLSKELDDLLNQLKPKDKELFMKLYIKQQDIDEVAADMGISKTNIYVRLSRGKKKLQKLFNAKEK
ncbi:MAG: sigma-70 family RNA polymerase sigma factor [Romboutsia sp.]|uniref:sigma-70 family RNA polymerase sigma factor n=1 Tax=Romboutsia sp. TaxID=1965302 RepID=UPI003F399BA2